MGRGAKKASVRGLINKARDKIDKAAGKVEDRLENASGRREDRKADRQDRREERIEDRVDRRDERRGNREDRQENRQDRRQENREDRQEKREEIKETLRDGLSAAVDAVEDLVDIVEDRFEAAQSMVSHTVSRIDVRIFPTQGDGFQFPESQNPDLQAKANVGIAFSGGGTRSASLSIGQMRSLCKAGLYDKARYVGSNSGGTWATLPFTYLPEGFTDFDYLGQSYTPQDMTVDVATSSAGIGIAGESIIASEIAVQSLIEIGLSKVFPALFREHGIPILKLSFGMDDADEIYGKILERVFLAPLGLQGPRYPVLNDAEIEAVLQRNADIRLNAHLEEDDFVTARTGRPYHCVSACMNQDYLNALDDEPAGDEDRSGFLNWEHVEFTPSYSGIHRHSRGKLNLNVGGGYVENIGWDTLKPNPQGNNVMRVSPGLEFHRLTLADIMSTSGAAPAFVAQYLNDLGKTPNLQSSIDIFPRFRNWPVAFNRRPVVVERAFGDGGYVDSYGLIPLLKRGVKTAIVFINTPTPIVENPGFPEGIEVDTSLHGLFGQPLSLSEAGMIDVGARMAPGSTFSEFDGQVFETGFAELIAGFVRTKRLAALSTTDGSEIEGVVDADSLNLLELPDTLTADEVMGLVHGPVYHLDTYAVRRNQFYGIEGGYRIKILWVYNERSQAWRDQLDPSANAMLQDADIRIQRDPNADPLDPEPYVDDDRGRNTPLGNFPHLSTFLTGRDEDRFRLFPEADMMELGVLAGLMRFVRRVQDRSEPIDLNPEHFNLLSNYSEWCMTKLIPLVQDDFE
jgi:hypothetical protein